MTNVVVRLTAALLWIAVPAVWPAGDLAAVQCTDGSPPPCRTARAASPARTSLAVLYFNAAGDTAWDYLADGITEEIISRLGQVGRLQVKSSYLVRRYRGADQDPLAIGRQLGVANVLTGTLRGSGGRVRVTAELVRTTTGDVAWSDRYERAQADLLALQSDLAGAVATAITGRLLPEERRAVASAPTRSHEAWDHFLRGNFLLAQRTPRSHAQAIAEYEAAARIDPTLTRALARVAHAYGVAAFRGDSIGAIGPDSAWRLGRAAADRALSMDRGSSDAWLALGLAQLQQPESLRVSLRSLDRAVSLDSASGEAHHMRAWALIFLGRTEEGLAAFHRVLAVEPGRPITLVALSFMAGVLGRHREGERWADSALAVERSWTGAYLYRARARMALGDREGMRSDFQLLAAAQNTPVMARFGDAAAALMAGDSVPMRALLRDGALPGLWVFIGLLLVGQWDGALDLWERGVDFKNPLAIHSLLWWPGSNMAGYPRYEAILDRWRVPAGLR